MSLTPYELQECLKRYLQMIGDGNWYDINAYCGRISLPEAREMVAMIPKIKEHLEENVVKKPFSLKSRK